MQRLNTYSLLIPYFVLKMFVVNQLAVGIATGYGLNGRGVGVRIPVREKYVSFSTSSRPVLGLTQPPVQWIPVAFPTEVKWPGHEADHLPPTSAEVKKPWIYTSTPPYVFMA
jgi:hypothetical protein